MKRILKFGCPVLLTILTLTGVTSFSLGQSEEGEKKQRPLSQNEWPTAKASVAEEANRRVFNFQLYYEIPEWKAERLEERLTFTYPDLQEIIIDPSNNSVRFEVLETTDATTIDKLFHHFKYRGYEEL